MSRESLTSQEIERPTVTTLSIPLVDVAATELEDPEHLGFADSTLVVTNIHNSNSDEYIAVIDHVLDPQALKSVLRTTTAHSGFVTPSETQSINWSLNDMQSLYEFRVTGKNPTPPGHNLIDMKSLRKQLLTTLNTDSHSIDDNEQNPEYWIGKKFGNFYDLDTVMKDLLQQDSYDGKLLRMPLYSSLSPTSYLNLLHKFNIVPQYESVGRERPRIKIYPRGSKIIDAMKEYPEIMQEFLSELPQDELEQLSIPYALSTHGGYITEDEVGNRKVVFGVGTNQQVRAETNEPFELTRGNVILSARLLDMTNGVGPGYTAFIEDARLKQYILPMLHWRNNNSYLRREWDFSQLEGNRLQDLQSQASDSTLRYYQEDKINPVIGLLTMFRYLQPDRSKWDDLDWHKKPFTPSHTIAAVALKQRQFLDHPVIGTIEEYFSTDDR